MSTNEQQIDVRSPLGHLHFSRRYGTAPWKFRGQCPTSDLTGLFESALNVVRRLEESHEQGEASSEPPRPSQGEADAVAQGGNQASEEGGSPSECVTADELRALRAENERLRAVADAARALWKSTWNPELPGPVNGWPALDAALNALDAGKTTKGGGTT